MNWTVKEVPELRGYTVEWAEAGNYYLSRRNVLYHSADLRPPFKQIATITAPSWKQIASNFRLAQRLLRFLITNVIPLPNGDVFVAFDKSVGIIRDGRYRDLLGLVRPCRILRSACAVDSSGDIYFGEYLANDERAEMRVYRYRPGSDSLEIAHTFPPKSIKHIHGVYFDQFSDSLLCLTGDEPDECNVLRTRDGFRTTEVVGHGDETWRAVSILFDDTAMYYGMDAEFRSNHIYKLERATSERTSLGEVNGTVFYSKQLGPDMFFATTAENAPSQKENVAAIWYVSSDGTCREVTRFNKDRWHGTLFMFGTIHFPSMNSFSDKLYFSVVGVDQDDRTFMLQRS